MLGEGLDYEYQLKLEIESGAIVLGGYDLHLFIWKHIAFRSETACNWLYGSLYK